MRSKTSFSYTRSFHLLEAVYFDAKQAWSIVAVRPKPPFRSIFEMAVTREGSGIHIIKNESSKTEAKNSSVFLVETGETLSLPALRYFALPFLRDTTPVAVG